MSSGCGVLCWKGPREVTSVSKGKHTQTHAYLWLILITSEFLQETCISQFHIEGPSSEIQTQDLFHEMTEQTTKPICGHCPSFGDVLPFIAHFN